MSEANKIEKEDYTAIAAHQLRTPLATLRWFLAPLLAEEFGRLTPEQKKFLSAFSSSTERMIDLLDTILNASRVERGGIEIKLVKITPAVFVKKLCIEMEPLAAEKGQDFSCHYPEDVPSFVGDERLLHEVLSNLLHNAVRYTPEKGAISFFVERCGEHGICFKIKDSGYGIPKDEQPRIFQKAFRASNIAKSFPDGTGLGLYVAKFFTELLGGRIWFESKVGKGTTFYVSLPVANNE